MLPRTPSITKLFSMATLVALVLFASLIILKESMTLLAADFMIPHSRSSINALSGSFSKKLEMISLHVKLQF